MLILKSTLLLLELSKHGDVQLWAKQSTSGNNQLLQGKFVYKTPSASHSTSLDTHPTTATFTGFMWVLYHTYLHLFTNTPWQGITVPLDPPAELVGSAPSHPISPQRAQVNKAFQLKMLTLALFTWHIVQREHNQTAWGVAISSTVVAAIWWKQAEASKNLSLYDCCQGRTHHRIQELPLARQIQQRDKGVMHTVGTTYAPEDPSFSPERSNPKAPKQHPKLPGAPEHISVSEGGTWECWGRSSSHLASESWLLYTGKGSHWHLCSLQRKDS